MNARLTFELDVEAAQAIHAALVPEAAEGPQGSTIDLQLDGSRLTAEVTADTLSTLRAAINNVVRLLDAAQRVAAG